MKPRLNKTDWENILWALDSLIYVKSVEIIERERLKETQSKVLKRVRPQKIWNFEEAMKIDE